MNILPRSAWTSTPNARTTPLQVARVIWLVLHWPASGQPIGKRTQAQIAAMLRGWRDFHMKSNGWRDIGYNVAFDQNGRIWNLTGDNVGAHAGTAGNTQGLGALLILGPGEQPSAEMIAALRWYFAEKRKKFNRMTTVRGHGQVPGNSTECPGPAVRALINSGAITRGGSTPARPATQEDDMTPAQAKKLDQIWANMPQQAGVKSSEGLLAKITKEARAAAQSNGAQIAALTAAVNTLAQAKGIDPADVRKSIEDALADFELTLKRADQ